MDVSNYPAGVTDGHPHFNEQEVELELQCGMEEMELVPSYWLKARLLELRGRLENLTHEQIKGALTDLLEEVYVLEDNGTFDCPFNAPVTLPVSTEAEWDCEMCGTAHTLDTASPDEEDGRDR